MTWMHPVLLFAALLILTLNGAESAAVRDDPADTEGKETEGAAKRIFMPEEEASNFFKRRSRRSVKSQAEINESRLSEREKSWRQLQESQGSMERPAHTSAVPSIPEQKLAADEHRREYYEEQRNEYENYVEERRRKGLERRPNSGGSTIMTGFTPPTSTIATASEPTVA
ncbi:hypothetical protein JZ751_008900 [Albula glossodonta]|uniref:Unique cartilage matrix-associated protein n=1 Tax=Albula glossodonta TaxID=121402 RepID=A0A8T2P1Z1_9TELE|nr:hypothetical protein JZ751_008900 [Albula glossodonta]